MSLKVTKSELKRAKSNSCNANWSVTFTAESTFTDMDSSIFVFQATDDNDPIEGDRFNNVASLADMDSLPKDAPADIEGDLTENYVPFYRKSTVTLDFNNVNEADRAWTIIQLDSRNLVREYHNREKLKPVEEVEYE